MTKIALMATFTAFAALPVTAWGQNATAFADGENRPTLLDPSPVRLAPDVARRVAELRHYGDQFAKAIRLMEAVAAKPSWSWGDDCGHGNVVQSEPVPES